MAGNSPSKMGSSVPLALILAIIGGAYYVSRAPLESSRPTPPPGLREMSPELGKIKARLWQDPLRAVLDHVDTKHGGYKPAASNSTPICPLVHSVNEIGGRIGLSVAEHDVNDSNTVVQILLVMVRDGASGEDYERRLRNRYTVLTSLQSWGMVPEDSKHIEYFAFDWAAKNPLEIDIYNNQVPRIDDMDLSYRPLVCPFEWFRREELYNVTAGGEHTKASRPESVLVVWLGESAFSDYPLTRLAQVIESLCYVGKKNVRIDLVGPSRSGTLKTMLKEIEKVASASVNDSNFIDVEDELDGLRIFSPWCTASPVLLVDDWPEKDPNVPMPGIYSVIPERFSEIGVKFFRMVGSDDYLAMHLINELRRRGIRSDEYVALSCEWDTFYGRAFPLTFSTMRECLGEVFLGFGGWEPNWVEYAERLVLKKRNELSCCSKNVYAYGYMSGLDGRILDLESEKSERSDEGEGVKDELHRTAIDIAKAPVGVSQLDYVGRFVEKLRGEENKPLGNKLKAVGVVGSDVYDKLLMVHAFRESLGDVLLFTVDLDARLLHRDQLKWTRNLIVASNFSLELSDKNESFSYAHSKRSVPPFRDNYQTSLFLACRAALESRSDSDQVLPGGVNEQGLAEVLAHPRIFEIGRGCAVDLSVDDGAIHPPRRTMPWRGAAKLLIPVLLGISYSALLLSQVWPGARKILLMVVPRAFRPKGGAEYRHGIWVKLAVLVVILFVVVVTIDHYRDGGEPFSVLKGVSIWPGEALRLTVILLSIWFIVRSVHDLKENEAGLRKEFVGLRKPAEGSLMTFTKWSEDNRSKGFFARWFSYWRWVRIHGWIVGPKKIGVQKIWKQYLNRSGAGNRFHRVIPMVLAFGGLGWALMVLLGLPNTPYRGLIALVCDKILLSVSVISMFFLMFFVVDATNLCVRFVRNLKECTTNWGAIAKGFTNKSDGDSTMYGEWLDIKFIASYTKATVKMIYYPFIVVGLMILARNRFFDDWDFPLSLVIVIVVYSVHVLACAIVLRRAAEEVRSSALKPLRKELVSVIGRNEKEYAGQLREMIAQIESIREGVFSPFGDNPVVRVLIGSGGVTLLAMMKYFPAN